MTDLSATAPDIAKPSAATLFPWMAPPKGTLRALFGTVLAADVLLWDTAWGLGLVLLVIAMAGTVAFLLRPDFSTRSAKIALTLFALSLLPAIEYVQPLSLLFMALGLAVFSIWCATLKIVLPLKALCFTFLAPLTALRDIPVSAANTPVRRGIGTLVVRWMRILAVPFGVGAIFVALLSGANPVLQSWLQSGSGLQLPDINGLRVMFWMTCAVSIWSFIAPSSLARIADTGLALRKDVPTRSRNGLLSAESITTSLVLFNVIFAAQNLMDAQYLWFHRALPEGITYSEYAHRGANALALAAVLAGGFALLVRRWSERPLLRVLLGLWIGQTLVLMVSALLRLDLYVDAYGLTRLRLTALFAMALIAAGLLLIGWQVWQRKSNAWLGKRIGIVAGVALYGLCFVNVAAVIATQQLKRSLLVPDLFDHRYVCADLGREAYMAILLFQTETGIRRCALDQNELPLTKDWRAWSFRHARMDSQIAIARGY